VKKYVAPNSADGNGQSNGTLDLELNELLNVLVDDTKNYYKNKVFVPPNEGLKGISRDVGGFSRIQQNF
jgi:hypothetical protein